MEINQLMFLSAGFGILRLEIAATARLVDVPSYMEAELKETLTFNISWQAEEDVTLTLARIIGSLDTQVLSVNSTDAEFFNNWANKGTADVINGTENTFHMTLTLDNIVLEDEGQYKILVEAESSSNTHYFAIQTYALPIYLQITSDSTNYTELYDASFTCTGNVGRPLGTLRLLRSASPGSADYFFPLESMEEIELAELLDPTAILPNGTYYVSHTFIKNMARQDNGTIFMCDIIHKVPAITIKESNQINVYVDFGGVMMSISPSSVYLLYTGQGQMTQTTFLCAGISAADVSTTVDKVISLKITRSTRRETQGQAPTVIAFIEPGAGARIPAVPGTTDIQNRAEVSGTVDSVDYTQSNLQLVIDSNAIQCDDVGQYTCLFTYRDTALDQHEVPSSMNLSVNALPSDILLSARRYGSTVEGPINNPYQMNEGDEIEFTCNGNIGSSTTVQFEWWITGNMGFIKFRPDIQPNAVETQGEAVQQSTACSYLRTTTMRYNITAADKNRGSLTFMCFAQVNPPSPAQSYPQNSTAFYITVAGGGNGGGGGGTGQVSTAGGSDAGVIAGATIGAIVFIVIVVLLVYFLWYRRRGGGDTYKTREETDGSNPNLAPTAADLYATPNKDRNRYGHENRGMDDHEANHLKKGRHDRDHDRKRHHDDDYDGKGHHNYAMDEDFESRDGSPSVQHMSGGPIGTGV